MNDEEDPYSLGWSDGYQDRLPYNPYPEDSIEWFEYEDGYEQGSRDC